jgi:hypothetical protein
MRRVLVLVCLLSCAGTEALNQPPADPASPSATQSPVPPPKGDASTTPPVEAGPTVDPNEVRFVALGDAGHGNDTQRNVAAAIARKCAKDKCDFAVMLGDNIYESGASSPDDPQFDTKFESIYAAIDLDFQIVLGNHDYGANGAGTDFGRAANEVAYTSRSRKWKLPAPHYRFSKGYVEFFVLDTNLQMFGRDDQQKRDVDGWLAASSARWKFALGHHPYLSNGKHGNAGNYDGLGIVPIVNGKGVKSFLEDHVCGKVDHYLAGHDHSQQWLTATCKGTQLVVSGAGSSVTTVTNTNPAALGSIEPGFVYYHVTRDVVTAQFITDKDAVLYTGTQRK